MSYKDPVKQEAYYKTYHAEYRRKNKDLLKRKQEAFYLANPQKRKEYTKRGKVWSKYRIRWHQKEAMFLEQGNRCAICRSSSPGVKDWCVDHDHETGKVRGILCNNCNGALGLFKDDPDVMELAAEYIRRQS